MWLWKNRGMQHIKAMIKRYQQPIVLVVFGLLLLFVVLGSSVSQSPLWMVAMIGGLLLCGWTVTYPRLALLLVFISAGLSFIVLHVMGHTVHLVEPALLLCVLIVIIRRPGIRLRYYHILALLFIGIAILSFIHVMQTVSDPDTFAADKRLYTLLLVFEAFFCGTFLVRYIKSVSTFLSTILLCHIPFYLLGLVQIGNIPLPAFLDSNIQDLFSTGLYFWNHKHGSGAFGLYLVNLLAVALACYIFSTRRRERFIGGLATIATTLEMVGSGSRGAALGGAILIVAFLLLTRRYKLLLGMLVVVLILCRVFFDKVALLVTQDQIILMSRLVLWRAAVQLIGANPWIGVGLQQFQVYSEHWPLALAQVFGPQIATTHNQYLEWALESGIGWLIVAILLLLSMLLKCWQAYIIARREQRTILMAAILALLTNILVGFFETPLDHVGGAIFLFLLAGIAVGYAEWVCKTSWRQKPLKPLSHIPDYRTFRLPGALSLPGIIKSANNDAPNTRKTVRAIVFQMVCWGITGAIMLPVTALLTRYLGPVQYGEYGFTLPFLAICALLSCTGMDPLIIRRLSLLPRHKWSDTLSYAAGSRFILTALAIVIVNLASLFLPVSNEQHILLLLGCCSLFFTFSYNGLRSIYTHGFQAEQRVTPLILLETINRLLVAVLVLVAIICRLPLVWTYVLIIYADLPCFVALLLITRRRFGIQMSFSWQALRAHALGSLALTGYDALTLITNQADVLLLMLFTGPMYVGLYVLAIRISDPLISLAAMYINGIYPLLCSTFENQREHFPRFYKEAMRVVSLAVIPLSIFVSIDAGAVVSLVGGQHFAAATTVVQLLMWATGIIFYSQLAVRSCMAANMEHSIPLVAGIAAVVNITGNLLCIPLWQAVGAGIISLTSEFLALVLFVFLLRKYIYPWRTMWAVLQVALGCAPMAAFLLWQQQASLLLTVPVSCGLTLLGCFATGGLTWRDVSLVWHCLVAGSSKYGDARRTESLDSNPLQAVVPDVAERPTAILPKLRDIADCPTLILPRVRV